MLSKWKIILRIILFFIYFILECNYEKRNYVSGVVAKNYSKLSKHDNKNTVDNQIALMSSKHPKYQIVKDSFLNIGANASVLEREVYYCQYEEIEETVRDENGAEHVKYRYEKLWTKAQINSNFFHSFFYQNPQRNDYYSFTNYTDFNIGDYKVDVGVFKGTNANVVWDVKNSNSFRRDFRNSEAHRNEKFRYIGDGIFYSPFRPKFRKNKKELLNAAKYATFCVPGDIKFIIKIFNPNEITVLGFKKGKKIIKNDINGTSYHKVSSGIQSLQYMLDSQASGLKISIRILLIALIIINIKFFDIFFIIIDMTAVATINIFSRAMNETISLAFNVSMSIIIIFVSGIVLFFISQYKVQKQNYLRFVQ